MKLLRLSQTGFATALLLIAQIALAVPGNPADPPMPPSDFGNLYDDGRPRVHDCRIDRTRSNASQSTIMFRSNYPHNRARYLLRGDTWSNWTSLARHEYVCTTPRCLWFAGVVEIRGCLDAAGTNCPSLCMVMVGPGVGGRPIVDPAGLPVPIANHVGCAQSDHTQLTLVAKWTGAAASSYPRVRDSGGNPIALTFLSGSTSAGVFTGTYTIPAGWSAGFEGTWSFEFLIDSDRTHLVNVKVNEHCLNAPRVYQVDLSDTRTPLYDGSTVYVGDASRMVIETGNAGLALTNHVLDPSTRTLGTVFNTTRPTSGNTMTESWSEAADGWDGRAYTSPDTAVRLTAARVACVSDGTHSFWLTPGSPSVSLPKSTATTTVAMVQTDACAGAVRATPVITPGNGHSLYGTIQVSWNVLAGSEATGWPVQATPALANGMIIDSATFTGTGWPSSGETIIVNREGATTCPPGQRPVIGVCEPCPNYRVCDAGTLAVRQWCNAGNPPADATTATYQACVNGTLTTQTACLNPGDSVPDDTPCPPPTCTDTERLVDGACEPCPTYNVCTASRADNSLSKSDARSQLLESRTFCDPGTPPNSAFVPWNYACINGVSAWEWQCIGEGGLASNPGSQPCSGDTCIEFDGCARKESVFESQATTNYYKCEPNPTPSWAPPQVIRRAVCLNRDTAHEAERNRYHCVGKPSSKGYRNISEVPADDPCSHDCYDYQACERQYSGQENADILTTATYCGADSPPADAYSLQRTWCNGGTTYTRTVCIGEGGFESDPGNQPCATCPSGERLINGVCEPCPTYYRCNGNNRVQRNWCSYSSTPADAITVSYQACVNGTTETVTTCVAAGGSAPADEPCEENTCSSTETYCGSGGVMMTRTIAECADRDLRPSSCPTGQEMNADGCCVDCAATETWCHGANKLTRNISGCVDRDLRPDSCEGGQELNGDGCCGACTSTETYCEGETKRTRTIAGCEDRDIRPDRCTGNQELNADGCCATCSSTEMYCEGPTERTRPIFGSCTDVDNRSATETYCNGSVPGTRRITGTCSDTDTTGATETYCVGANKHTRPIAGCVDRDLRPSNCPGGQQLNADGCCGSCTSRETYCVGTTESTRPIAACEDLDSRSATETYCNGSVPDTRTITGTCANTDTTGATRYYCVNGSERTSSLAGCVDDDDRTATETYCNGSVPDTRTITGTCTDTNTTGATRYYCVGGSERTSSIAGCVDDDDRTATETYCNGSVSDTRTITGTCVNTDSTGATETYCVGANKRTRSIAGCEDRDLRPDSCPGGQELNADGCCGPCISTMTYCDGSTESTKPIAGCEDRDTRSATETYCNGSARDTRTITGTCSDTDTTGATRYYCVGGTKMSEPISGCVDDDDRPSSCPSGKSFNDDGCLVNAAACPAGEVAEGWLSAKCSWNCVPDTSNACDTRPTVCETTAFYVDQATFNGMPASSRPYYETHTAGWFEIYIGRVTGGSVAYIVSQQEVLANPGVDETTLSSHRSAWPGAPTTQPMGGPGAPNLYVQCSRCP